MAGICSVEGCSQKVRCKGLCPLHYDRWIKRGSTDNPRKSLKQRFLEKIREDSETGCWEWQGSKNNHGYGVMGVGRSNRAAHRVGYELYRRPLEKGELALHRCDNPGCVNPRHIFTGDQKANVRDMNAKGRGNYTKEKVRGSRSPNSKLTEADVAELKRRLLLGEPKTKLARDFNISRAVIWNIQTGKAWTHVEAKPCA
jgi:hypothetical protein